MMLALLLLFLLGCSNNGLKYVSFDLLEHKTLGKNLMQFMPLNLMLFGYILKLHITDLSLCSIMYTEMPKQNRVKNLFKSIKGRSSLTPEQSSHAQSQSSHAQSQAQASSSSSDRVSSRHTHPIVPSSSTNRVSSHNVVPSSSTNRVSSQNVIPSSSSDRVSSQNVIVFSSSDGVSSQPTGRRRVIDDTESEPCGWVVGVINENQVIKFIKLKVQDVHNLENELRIIVECDEFAQPIGKSAGILAGFFGELATNPCYFPIGFESWTLMPKPFMH
ncbi:uncharacterized protein [Nicotiana sylvestris]|uniref:uncharacterized protein n=1 Tax=Nicotiana sylvestris TaxID=4096 RepID=UPI00388C9322